MSFGDCPVFRLAQRGLPAKANRSSRRLPIPSRAFAPSFPAAIGHRPARLAPVRRRRHTAAFLSVCCSSAPTVEGARAVKATRRERGDEARRPRSRTPATRQHPQRGGGCQASTRSPLTALPCPQRAGPQRAAMGRSPRRVAADRSPQRTASDRSVAFGRSLAQPPRSPPSASPGLFHPGNALELPPSGP